MRLRFYFEFPCGDPDDENSFVYSNVTHLISSLKLYRLCKKEHPDIEFEAVNAHELDEEGRPAPKRDFGPACRYSHFYCTIENPDNKKYFNISYWDKLRGMSHGTFWDMENCVELFAALGVQANEDDYSDAGIKYTPISHMSLHQDVENRIKDLYDKEKITPTKLFFRGGKYGIREFLSLDERFTIDDGRVFPIKFIEEIAPYSINLDINGAAEVSCRTFDILGLQSCLIRPKLTIKYHNELIPDYHYAALKCNDLGRWDDVADAYVERFEELRNNPEEVRFIAANGRKWYEENATVDAHVKVIKSVMDLYKLK